MLTYFYSSEVGYGCVLNFGSRFFLKYNVNFSKISMASDWTKISRASDQIQTWHCENFPLRYGLVESYNYGVSELTFWPSAFTPRMYASQSILWGCRDECGFTRLTSAGETRSRVGLRYTHPGTLARISTAWLHQAEVSYRLRLSARVFML